MSFFDSVFILLFIIILIGHYQKKESPEIDKQTSTQLKGILAFLILFHHISLFYSNFGYLFPHLSTIGYLCAGCFFALSGYGLTKERMLSKLSFTEYIRKRLKGVVCPFGFATLVYLCWEIIICNNRDILNLFKQFCEGDLVKHSWYIIVSIVLYFIFGLIFYHKIKHKELTIFAASIVIILFLWITFKENMFWYRSLMCFWFGVVYAEKYDYQHSFRDIVINFLLSGILFVAVMLIYQPALKNGSYHLLLLGAIMNISSIMLVATLFGLLSRYDYHSPIWIFMGNISYEIYMYQGLAMGIVERLLGDGYAEGYVIIPCIVVLTVVIALVANWIGRLR